jgi:hypothetical protein
MSTQKWFAFLLLGAVNIALLVGGAYAMRAFEASAENARNAEYNALMNVVAQFYANCSLAPYSQVCHRTS